MERDRYNFKLEDQGDEIDLHVSLVAKSGKIPDVNQMTASIRLPDRESVGIALRADDLAPGTFHGQIRVKRTEQTQRAVLSLRESGPDALPRAQQLPIFIPPKGNINPPTRSEAYTYGQNRILLKKIAEISGGMYDPSPAHRFFKKNPHRLRAVPSGPIWQQPQFSATWLAIAVNDGVLNTNAFGDQEPF